MTYHLSFLQTFKNIMSWKLFFFQPISSLSQDLCQDLVWLTFHDVILLTDLWNYGSGKHWLFFSIFFCNMHDIYARRFPVGTDVLSFADLKAESSSSQHTKMFKEEGRLSSKFDIETSSGARYSSSEMVMSLIYLLKMPAAACKICLSSHIWTTFLKSWTVAECISAFMRVAAPIASGVEMTLL